MQQAMKFSAKVSYMGETKRMTQLANFEELTTRTSEAFANLPENVKFFYTDSENDLICVSSQIDLDEAPLFYFGADGIKTATVIKLTVAQTSQQAFEQITAANSQEQSDAASEAFVLIDTQHNSQPAEEFVEQSAFQEETKEATEQQD